MPKLPAVKPKSLEKALEKIGFVKIHTKGSHANFSHADGRKCTIPMHGREIPKGTLLAIIRDIEVTKDDLIKLLK